MQPSLARPGTASTLLLITLVATFSGCRGMAESGDPARTGVPSVAGGSQTWSCGDHRVVTRLDGEGLVLRLPDGRSFELTRERAASGAKYGNGAVTFWGKGNEAMLELDGQRSDCVQLTRGRTSSQARGSVSGTITYRERIALSPEAVVEVQLVDASRQDVAALVLAEQTIREPGQVPIAFKLDYDPSRIDSRHTYQVKVRITDRGRLRFITTTAYGVLTRGHPDTVEVVVHLVGR